MSVVAMTARNHPTAGQPVKDLYEVGEVEGLAFVMAAGVNYNGVWAGRGLPISPFDVHKQPFHVAGSDASGIVWAVGAKVKRWKVGDEVVVHCNQDDGDDEECNGGDPMLSGHQCHRLRPGMIVLVWGASGGRGGGGGRRGAAAGARAGGGGAGPTK